jgi:putative transposase
MAMSEPVLNIRRRNLPHWTMDGSTYFITFRTHKGTLTADERRLLLDHLKSGNEKFYRLAAVVVMPDHVHLLLSPLPPYELSRVMKGIKGVSARRINDLRKAAGTVWQDESWDRIVRDEDEFLKKLEYMAHNPIKAGLVATIEAYDSFYFDPAFLLIC